MYGSEYDVEAAVKRGVDLLNTIRPGWQDSIDVETLKLSNGTQCIVGQLYGDYWGNVRKVMAFEGRDVTPYDADDISEFGFTKPDSVDESYWESLTDEWVAAIARLKEPKTPAHVKSAIAEALEGLRLAVTALERV